MFFSLTHTLIHYYNFIFLPIAHALKAKKKNENKINLYLIIRMCEYISEVFNIANENNYNTNDKILFFLRNHLDISLPTYIFERTLF